MEKELASKKVNLQRKFAFDMYGRYCLIRDVIEKNRTKGDVFKVLDVGGRGNILREFLPVDNVYYLDPLVETNDENYIQGDGCDMPLDDNSFDFVVSGDVLEHIPESKRVDFIREQVRVSKIGAIIAAPFYSQAAKDAEVRLQKNYKILSNGKQHHWLEEHIENGLPKPEQIEKFISENNLSSFVMYNNNVLLWESLMNAYFFIEHNYEGNVKDLFEEYNEYYNNEIFPLDRGESSYRRLYTIFKNKILISPYEKNVILDATKITAAISKIFTIIDTIDVKNRFQLSGLTRESNVKQEAVEHYKKEIAALNEARDHYNTEVQNLNTAVEHFKSESAAKSALVATLEQSITEYKATTADNNHELLLLVEELHAKNAHIEAMEQTLAWKLRNRYFALKKKIRG